MRLSAESFCRFLGSMAVAGGKRMRELVMTPFASIPPSPLISRKRPNPPRSVVPELGNGLLTAVSSGPVFLAWAAEPAQLSGPALRLGCTRDTCKTGKEGAPE